MSAAAAAAAEMAVADAAAAAAAGKGKEKVDEPATGSSKGRFLAYPPRMAEHKAVVADAARFRAALERLHAHMGTKLKVPIIGGKDLDLHQLFKEVTSRGGIDKDISAVLLLPKCKKLLTDEFRVYPDHNPEELIDAENQSGLNSNNILFSYSLVKAENRWREVTASFIFPATATNASFMLKKYYMSLLYHFEQQYFFGAQGWHEQETDHRSMSCVEVRAETQATQKRKRGNSGPSDPASSSDNVDVDVLIDGKFEHGYIVTVTTGSKSTKAILYNFTEEPALATPAPAIAINNTDLKGGRRRKQRRKKLSTTDPRHPKPNRSGYNFFFQDQHRMLKPEYPGRDRLISKMIGERWNNLSPEDKAVYQERGVQDKERYQAQLAAYREEIRTGLPISNAVPIQQRFPRTEVTIDEVDSNVSKGDMLLSNQGYNNSSDESDDSGGKLVEDEEFNTETSPEPSMETTDSPGQLNPSADGDQFELRRRENPKENEKQNAPPS